MVYLLVYKMLHDFRNTKKVREHIHCTNSGTFTLLLFVHYQCVLPYDQLLEAVCTVITSDLRKWCQRWQGSITFVWMGPVWLVDSFTIGIPNMYAWARYLARDSPRSLPHAEMHTDLHVQCPLLLPNTNWKWYVMTIFFVQFKKIYNNSICGIYFSCYFNFFTFLTFGSKHYKLALNIKSTYQPILWLLVVFS